MTFEQTLTLYQSDCYVIDLHTSAVLAANHQKAFEIPIHNTAPALQRFLLLEHSQAYAQSTFRHSNQPEANLNRRNYSKKLGHYDRPMKHQENDQFSESQSNYKEEMHSDLIYQQQYPEAHAHL